MAKATLPVNFQDDILNASMNGKRRYRMTQNSDGTVSFEDVTDYDQVGNNFGGAQINQTNAAVNASVDASKIIDSLDAIAANTQKDYMAGALAVKELNNSLIVSTALYVNVNPITIPAGGTGEIPLQLVSGKVGARFIGITRVYTGSWGLSVVSADISSIMAINHTAYAITVGARAAAVGAAYLG